MVENYHAMNIVYNRIVIVQLGGYPEAIVHYTL